jgi:hypothetical protein
MATKSVAVAMAAAVTLTACSMPSNVPMHGQNIERAPATASGPVPAPVTAAAAPVSAEATVITPFIAPTIDVSPPSPFENRWEDRSDVPWITPKN